MHIASHLRVGSVFRLARLSSGIKANKVHSSSWHLLFPCQATTDLGSSTSGPHMKGGRPWTHSQGADPRTERWSADALSLVTAFTEHPRTVQCKGTEPRTGRKREMCDLLFFHLFPGPCAHAFFTGNSAGAINIVASRFPDCRRPEVTPCVARRVAHLCSR